MLGTLAQAVGPRGALGVGAGFAAVGLALMVLLKPGMDARERPGTGLGH